MIQCNRSIPILIMLAVFALNLLGHAAGAAAEKRAALVIGNGAYTAAPALKNPVNDASDVAERLTALGFEVVTVIDGDHRRMLDAMSLFGRAATGADVALFFYAGHGVQVGGRNWLLPVSSQIEAATDLPSQAIRTGDVIDVMEASGASLKLVLLDACRNNPLPNAVTRGTSRGLARLDAGTAGTMITFATAPGAVAADGDGRNSPFTAALLQHIATPGLEIRQLMGRVRETVYEHTNEQQLPWVNEALIGEFYFGGEDPNAPQIPMAKNDPASAPGPEPLGPSEREAFALAQSINTMAAWKVFLDRYPDGAYGAFAVAARDKLGADPGTQAPAPSAPAAPQLKTARQTPGFVFAHSGSRPIAKWELEPLSRAELRIARNEIFARRGQHFRSADLRRHFGRFGWYRPHTWDAELNTVERGNVQLILRTERSR